MIKAEITGYQSPVPWTNAALYVRYVQGGVPPPRPMITFPAANVIVERADLKVDWTMSAGDLGAKGTVRRCGAMHAFTAPWHDVYLWNCTAHVAAQCQSVTGVAVPARWDALRQNQY